MRGDGHWGPRGELGEIGEDKTPGSRSYLHPLFRRSPSEWDQITQTESEPISTGPFPRDLYNWKIQNPPFSENPKASLAY